MSERTLTGIVTFAGFKRGMGVEPTISYRDESPEVNFNILADNGEGTPIQMPIRIRPEEISDFSNFICGKRVEFHDSLHRGLMNKELRIISEVTDSTQYPIEYSAKYRMS
jgi:hypothetical protein